MSLSRSIWRRKTHGSEKPINMAMETSWIKTRGPASFLRGQFPQQKRKNDQMRFQSESS